MNFEQWWHEHGSGWRIADGDDCEDHARKAAALAWDEARAPQPAEQQPAPDVSALVEALEAARADLQEWMRSFPVARHEPTIENINRIDAALAAHRKGGEE